MKIAFLCTSLAPGRDGVGDYVRQLAAACAEHGHVCLLVALHDRHLAPSAALLQRTNEVRLAASLSWSRRAAMLTDLLRDFEPHWVSWQIVAYGFHPKGILPPGSFALIDSTRLWENHVTLHELWLGLAQRDRLRMKVVGALQRRRLLAFLRHLRPACVHTTNPAYQLALAHHGWPSELLPLFGNMPVLPVKPYLARAELTDLFGQSFPQKPGWIGVIFGTIHPQWRPEPTLNFLRAVSEHSGQSIALLALGRSGAHGAKLLSELSGARSGISGISLFVAGPQTPERISHVLQAADFGLATHPWALIEKSGTTATLLEHGLPVLVPRDDWQLRHGTITRAHDPLLRRMADLSPESFARWLAERRDPTSLLPVIAAKFLAHLGGPVPRGALVA